LQSFGKNLKFDLHQDHQKFVSAFEKKLQSPQAQESALNFSTNSGGFKTSYIPARKFFTSLILLGKDFPCDKAE
jgi:hypothetical protein